MENAACSYNIDEIVPFSLSPPGGRHPTDAGAKRTYCHQLQGAHRVLLGALHLTGRTPHENHQLQFGDQLLCRHRVPEFDHHQSAAGEADPGCTDLEIASSRMLLRGNPEQASGKLEVGKPE